MLPDAPGRAFPIVYEPGTAGGLVVSQDQERVNVGGTEGVRVYDLADGTLLDEPFAGFQLATDRDGGVVAVGQLDGTLTLRDGETLDPLGPDIVAPPGALLALSPDGSILRVVGVDHVGCSSTTWPARHQSARWWTSGRELESEILDDRRSFLLQRDGVHSGADPRPRRCGWTRPAWRPGAT